RLVGEGPPLRRRDLFPPGHQPRARLADAAPRIDLARSAALAASFSTCRSRRATGVSVAAESPGHPVPGGTGDSKTAPVTGCGSDVAPIPPRYPPLGQRGSV